MPSRMIREGYLDSDPLRQAGELAEILFTRLMLVADDYGRFDGRVTVICRRCWPLGGPTETDVSQRIVALVREGLVVLYEVGGKPFIFIPKFNQRLRLKSASKWPDPPEISTASAQMPDTCRTLTDHPPDACAPEAEAHSEVEANAEEKRKAVVTRTTEDQVGTFAAAAIEKIQHQPLPLAEARIDSAESTPAGTLSAICIANGIRANPFHPLVVEWARDGVTVDGLKNAIATARQRKPPPENIPPAYLDKILQDRGKPAPDTGWRRDDAKAANLCAELGIPGPKRGEEMPAFHARVEAAIHERARSQVQ